MNCTLQPAMLTKSMVRGMTGSDEDPTSKAYSARVSNGLNHMNSRLLSNTWLAGDEFTAADTMSAWAMTTMRKFVPIDLSDYQGILAWLDRIGKREAYRRAMGKSDPGLSIDEGLSAKGPPLHEAFAKAMGIKQ